MKLLKHRLRGQWLDHLRQSLSTYKNQPSAEPFRLPVPTRHQLATWLKDAWGDLSHHTIANGFRSLRVNIDIRAAANYNTEEWGCEAADVVERPQRLRVSTSTETIYPRDKLDEDAA